MQINHLQGLKLFQSILITAAKEGLPIDKFSTIRLKIVFDSGEVWTKNYGETEAETQAMNDTQLDGPLPDQTPPPFADPNAPRHSPDYRSVYLNGRAHDLTATQARIVKQLWEAAEQGLPSLSAEYLLEQADSTATRLSDVFKGCLLWGTSIVQGGSKGSYRLELC